MENSSTILNWNIAAPAKSVSEQLQKQVDYAKGLFMAWRKRNPEASNILVFKHVLQGYLVRVLLSEGQFEVAFDRLDAFWEEYTMDYISIWEKEYQSKHELI